MRSTGHPWRNRQVRLAAQTGIRRTCLLFDRTLQARHVAPWPTQKVACRPYSEWVTKSTSDRKSAEPPANAFSTKTVFQVVPTSPIGRRTNLYRSSTYRRESNLRATSCPDAKERGDERWTRLNPPPIVEIPLLTGSGFDARREKCQGNRTAVAWIDDAHRTHRCLRYKTLCCGASLSPAEDPGRRYAQTILPGHRRSILVNRRL